MAVAPYKAVGEEDIRRHSGIKERERERVRERSGGETIW